MLEITGIKVGAQVKGSIFYGKKNELTGVITNIEDVGPVPGYRGDDIITIKWDNGQVVRFNRSSFWGK